MSSSLLDQIAAADYSDETDVFRKWLNDFDEVPQAIELNGEPYTIKEIHPSLMPAMTVTNQALQQEKGKPNSLVVGPSADGNKLVITNRGAPNRIWEPIESLAIPTEGATG